MKSIILACAAVASLAAATGALALDHPSPGKQDARVRFVDYQQFDVVRIVGALRSSVQIEFAADEDITHVALGNTVAWEVAVAGNIMFLKPRETQPPTNAQVVTTRRDGTRRSYQFEVVVRDEHGETRAEKQGDPRGDASSTYFYVKFRYSADEAKSRSLERTERAANADAGRADRILALDQTRGPRNWRYVAQGAAAIEPISVYDNGKLTTFVFTGNTEIPAIYLENTDGSESLVPKSVEGDLVLVHAIGAKFLLRRGRDVLAVTNEGFHPAGINPGTNTTSPVVERVINGKAVKAATSAQSAPQADVSTTVAVLPLTPMSSGAAPPQSVRGPTGSTASRP